MNRAPRRDRERGASQVPSRPMPGGVDAAAGRWVEPRQDIRYFTGLSSWMTRLRLKARGNSRAQMKIRRHSRMARKLTKKQIEHLQQRLLRERERALRSLGQYDELAKESAEQNDSDSYSYSDHMADLGTDAMEREKMMLFASKEGRYLYRVEDALRRLYKEPDKFGLCHSCGELIDFDRLDALPHARYCIDCKLKEEADAA
jgi:RNA polymerase-binding transcription factor DksA